MDSTKLEKIRKISRCPKCASRLTFTRESISCTEPGCGTVYSYEKNVPVLITSEEREKIRQFLSRHSAQTVPAINSTVKARLFPPSQSYDPRRKERMDPLWRRFDESSVVVDVGAQTASLRKDVINLDMTPFRNVDLVGYALRLPLADNSVDFLINTGLLEHVESLPAVLAEFHRVLKSDGLLYTEIPFMQGFHPDPTDFERLTYQGLTREMARFRIDEMEVSSGPFSNICWSVREALACLCTGRQAFTWTWMAVGWLTFWIKYLDKLAVGKPYAHRFASSYYVIAGKNGHVQ
jgi:SAM-dependent methyltransferase